MTVYAVFMCLALYADGPHCERGHELYDTRAACEASIRDVWHLQKAPDGRFYNGSPQLWFECLAKRVEVWK
jgi:hypothetical protein